MVKTLTMKNSVQLLLQHCLRFVQGLKKHPVLAAIGAVVGGFLFLASFTSAVEDAWRYWNILTENEVREPAYERVLSKWREDQVEFIEKTGVPGKRTIAIDTLWYQFFEQGLILHNSTHGWTHILDLKNKTWTKVPKPEALISEHHQDAIDWGRFEESIPRHVTDQRKQVYKALISDRRIIGGIGTIFVAFGLLDALGTPEHCATKPCERPFHYAAYINGPPYALILNVPNRSTDDPNTDTNRSVVVLRENGTFVRHVVRLSVHP
jgi:hypothetical protein